MITCLNPVSGSSTFRLRAGELPIELNSWSKESRGAWPSHLLNVRANVARNTRMMKPPRAATLAPLAPPAPPAPPRGALRVFVYIVCIPELYRRVFIFSGMVTGMATTKVTITVDNDQLQEIRELVAKGRASSVSAFIKHAVGVALHDVAGWKEMLEG